MRVHVQDDEVSGLWSYGERETCALRRGYDPTTCTWASAIDCAYTCICVGFSLR